MDLLDTLYDERSKCYSFLFKMTLKEYLNITEEAYEEKGHLEGQRDKLSTTTAIRIRRRMINDLEAGAILPPVVLGILIEESSFGAIEEWIRINKENAFSEIDEDNISIIDGMQRTTAYIAINSPLTENNEIRVEIWVSTNVENLTYRMLVLNTGQAPWNLRRQLEVIFRPLIKTITIDLFEQFPDLKENVTIPYIDDKTSRTKGGVYHANQIIETYIAFALRKDKVDTQSVLADEFSKLDMIDAVSNSEFIKDFTIVLGSMCKLDLEFSKFNNKLSDGKISIGRNIFDSQPARIGFFTSAAQKVMGVPGVERSKEEQKEALDKVKNRCNKILEYVKTINSEDQAKEFFSFDILNERISKLSTARIGDEERTLFKEAFKVFFDNEDIVNTLGPCWRAY